MISLSCFFHQTSRFALARLLGKTSQLSSLPLFLEKVERLKNDFSSLVLVEIGTVLGSQSLVNQARQGIQHFQITLILLPSNPHVFCTNMFSPFFIFHRVHHSFSSAPPSKNVPSNLSHRHQGQRCPNSFYYEHGC